MNISCPGDILLDLIHHLFVKIDDQIHTYVSSLLKKEVDEETRNGRKEKKLGKTARARNHTATMVRSDVCGRRCVGGNTRSGLIIFQRGEGREEKR
jgi:hypothetical protein